MTTSRRNQPTRTGEQAEAKAAGRRPEEEEPIWIVAPGAVEKIKEAQRQKALQEAGQPGQEPASVPALRRRVHRRQPDGSWKTVEDSLTRHPARRTRTAGREREV